MLAQNFMTAADLGISEEWKDALCKTLVLFETGKIHLAQVGDSFYPGKGREFTGHFNMCQWNSLVHGCGTVACIGGTAEMVGNVKFGGSWRNNDNLYRLFMPNLPDSVWPTITPEQAATALRSYLTTGKPNWSEALASRSCG